MHLITLVIIIIIIIIIIINEFHREASLKENFKNLHGRSVSRVALVSMLLLPVVCVAVCPYAILFFSTQPFYEVVIDLLSIVLLHFCSRPISRSLL